MIHFGTAVVIALIANALTYMIAYKSGKKEGYGNGYVDGAVGVHLGNVIITDRSEEEDDDDASH